MASRAALGAAAALALAAQASAAVVLSGNGEPWTYVAYDGLVAIAASFVSLLVWAQRRRGVVGPLLYLYTLVFIVMALRNEPNTLLISGTWLAISLLPPVFSHLVLAFPAGRLETAADRVFVALVYSHGVAFAVATLIVGPAGMLFGGCGTDPCPSRPPLLGAGDAAWFERLLTWRDRTLAPLIVCFVALVARRVWRAGARRRRQLAPIAVAAAAVTAVFVVFGPEQPGHWFGDLSAHAAHLGLTVAFFVGYWSTGLERAGVADLMAQMAAAPAGELEPRLARLLRDPALRLHRATDPELTRELPPGRATSVVVGRRGPLAVLVHDATVVEDERLLAAVLSAVALALENAALRDELVEQLTEVRASRQRIVEASDRARRQLERDLHDSAQQRLLSAGMALQFAARELPDGTAARELLDDAAAEVRSAIAEMREITRAVHPAVLSERGLRAALTALAQRSTVPVTISGRADGPLPDPVQVAAYYAVSEALQNVAKHASATTVSIDLCPHAAALIIRIRDDGRGGADPNNGRGLRGLADRVEAIGGALRIDSPPGAGTELVVELPCA